MFMLKGGIIYKLGSLVVELNGSTYVDFLFCYFLFYSFGVYFCHDDFSIIH